MGVLTESFVCTQTHRKRTIYIYIFQLISWDSLDCASNFLGKSTLSDLHSVPLINLSLLVQSSYIVIWFHCNKFLAPPLYLGRSPSASHDRGKRQPEAFYCGRNPICQFQRVFYSLIMHLHDKQLFMLVGRTKLFRLYQDLMLCHVLFNLTSRTIGSLFPFFPPVQIGPLRMLSWTWTSF